MYTALRLQGKVVAIQQLLADGSVMSIPLNAENRDYQEFLKWLAEGNTLDLSDQPYTPPPEIVEHDSNLSDLRAQYQAATDRLNQIISAQNPTNAQVITAIKDMATIQLRVLKFLRWLI